MKVLINVVFLISMLTCIMCATGEKAPASDDMTSSAQKDSPCNSNFAPDTIIPELWLGKTNKATTPEVIQFPFKVDSLNYGSIKIVPRWEADTLVELKFNYIASRGSKNEMMKASIFHLTKKLKEGCGQILMNTTKPERVTCGRTNLLMNSDSAIIIMTDACRDFRMKK